MRGEKRRARLVEELQLTDDEISKIIMTAKINLATFDPEYSADIKKLASDYGTSRVTAYAWADKVIQGSIAALRSIQIGRPRTKKPQMKIKYTQNGFTGRWQP